MRPFVVLTLAVATALFVAVPAGASAPDKETSHTTFSAIDEEASAACGFDVQFSLDRTRTVTTFANGDVKRHTHLILTWAANGKTIVENATFNVMIENGSATWTIVGAFVHQRMKGEGTIVLVSGKVLFDATTGELVDLHPGPRAADDAAALEQVCDLLAA